MSRRNAPHDEAMDYVAIKGPFTLRITPRTARGWRGSIVWMLILLAPYVPYTIFASHVDDTPREYWAIIAMGPMLLLTALSIWAMCRWMLKRAIILTPDEFADVVARRNKDPRR